MKTNIWHKHYDEGVSPSLEPYPDKTLIDFVNESEGERPGWAALKFMGATVSYSKFRKKYEIMAAGLSHSGVRKGTHVALLLPNSPQMVISMFGSWRSGAVVSPINPLYTENELKEVLSRSEAEIAVVLDPFYEKVKSVQKETKVRKIISVNIKTFLPSLLKILFTLFKEKKEGYGIKLRDNDVDFDTFLKTNSTVPIPDLKISGDDPAVMMFSGGTTGTPKAAIGLHKHLVMSGMQYNEWLKNVVIGWDDILMDVMPLFHIYGLAGVLATAFTGHNPLLLVPNPRDINDVLKSIEREKPAFLPGVPTLFVALMNHPKVLSGKANLTSLKLCICGAAPLLLETKQRFEKITGGKIIEGYALTESMMAGVFTPAEGKYKEGSVGIPIPDVEVKIVDKDNGEKELGFNETGEIIMKAPQLMKEYWKNREETFLTVRNGWLYTGDIGYMDEDGYIFLVDRKKDVIKSSGFQVWPREVEEVLASHPAVSEVGVTGIPDKLRGEIVKAWIVLNEGEKVSRNDLMEFCRKKLSGYKVPREIEFCDCLPKSHIGKILRRKLAENEKSAQSSQQAVKEPL